MFFVLAAKLDLECEVFDIKNAFVGGQVGKVKDDLFSLAFDDVSDFLLDYSWTCPSEDQGMQSFF
jgi:hypothetical protein